MENYKTVDFKKKELWVWKFVRQFSIFFFLVCINICSKYEVESHLRILPDNDTVDGITIHVNEKFINYKVYAKGLFINENFENVEKLQNLIEFYVDKTDYYCNLSKQREKEVLENNILHTNNCLIFIHITYREHLQNILSLMKYLQKNTSAIGLIFICDHFLYENEIYNPHEELNYTLLDDTILTFMISQDLMFQYKQNDFSKYTFELYWGIEKKTDIVHIDYHVDFGKYFNYCFFLYMKPVLLALKNNVTYSIQFSIHNNFTIESRFCFIRDSSYCISRPDYINSNVVREVVEQQIRSLCIYENTLVEDDINEDPNIIRYTKEIENKEIENKKIEIQKREYEKTENKEIDNKDNKEEKEKEKKKTDNIRGTQKEENVQEEFDQHTRKHLDDEEKKEKVNKKEKINLKDEVDKIEEVDKINKISKSIKVKKSEGVENGKNEPGKDETIKYEKVEDKKGMEKSEEKKKLNGKLPDKQMMNKTQTEIKEEAEKDDKIYTEEDEEKKMESNIYESTIKRIVIQDSKEKIPENVETVTTKKKMFSEYFILYIYYLFGLNFEYSSCSIVDLKKSSKERSYKLLEMLGVSTEIVDKCFLNNFHSYMQKMIKRKFYIYSVTINGKTYKTKLNKDVATRLVCDAFRTMPAYCVNYLMYIKELKTGEEDSHINIHVFYFVMLLICIHIMGSYFNFFIHNRLNKCNLSN